MTIHRPRQLATIVASVWLLASCTLGGAEEDTAPSTLGETTTTSNELTIAYESPTSEDFNRLLTSTDGLTNLSQAEILAVDSGAPSAGGFESSVLVISFEMESHHCFGVQTSVTESDQEVILEILTGQLPGIEPTACEYGVYPYTTELSLSAPVGDRTVVPAEGREPDDLRTAPDSTTPDSTAPDSNSGGNPDDNGSAQPGTETTPTTAEGIAGDGAQGTTTDPPDGQTGQPPVGGASDLIGKFTEHGVEWALDNGLEWRILSFDGEPFAEETPFNSQRISFVVEADRIVSFEWS